MQDNGQGSVTMKDKRIWIVIGCILVIGTGVTHYTKYYVNSQETVINEMTEALAYEEAPGAPSPASSSEVRHGEAKGSGDRKAAADVSAPAGRSLSTAPSSEQEELLSAAPAAAEAEMEAETSADGQMAAGTAADGETAVSGETAAMIYSMDEAPAEAVPISPLTGARMPEEKNSLSVDYRQRLEDLDTQIQRIREQETDSNVYSIKTSAETELKMWEGELNTIYNALLELLPQEEAAGLASEQQEWMKNRDTKAAESSGRNSGSVESVNYAATLVSLTRERAYELAGRYEKANGIQVLPEEETTSAVSGQ